MSIPLHEGVFLAIQAAPPYVSRGGSDSERHGYICQHDLLIYQPMQEDIKLCNVLYSKLLIKVRRGLRVGVGLAIEFVLC